MTPTRILIIGIAAVAFFAAGIGQGADAASGGAVPAQVTPPAPCIIPPRVKFVGVIDGVDYTVGGETLFHRQTITQDGTIYWQTRADGWFWVPSDLLMSESDQAALDAYAREWREAVAAIPTPALNLSLDVMPAATD